MGTVTDINAFRAAKAEEARDRTAGLSDSLKRSVIADLLTKPFTELTDQERDQIVRWLHVSHAYRQCERNALSELLRGDA